MRYIEKYFLDKILFSDSSDRVFSKPLDVLCEITYNCNLKCPTCFRWTSGQDENELGTGEWKDIITGLKKWLGTFFLSFSGGEPFLRKDILDIVSFASEKGILVSAISNGSLIDRPFAEKIISSGLDVLSLSLNSLDPVTHNKLRGTDRSFHDVMSAAGNLKDRGGMRLMLNTTIVRSNINELIDLVEFAKAEGLDGINLQPLMEASAFPLYDKDGRTEKYPEGKFYHEIGKEMRNVDEVFRRLIAMKEKGYPINNSVKHLNLIAGYLKNPGNPALSEAFCRIGAKNFFIDPFGNVRICSVMEPVGNIAKEAPARIWNSAKTQEQRRMIRDCRKVCRLMSCNFKELDLGYRIKAGLKGLKRH